MGTVQSWYEIDDVDAESPGCPWNCDCPICRPLHEAAALALANPAELGVPEDEPVRLVSDDGPALVPAAA